MVDPESSWVGKWQRIGEFFLYFSRVLCWRVFYFVAACILGSVNQNMRGEIYRLDHYLKKSR